MEGVHISSSSEEGLSACDLIPLDECSLRQKWTEMAVILLQPEQLKNRGVNDLPQSQMGWIEMKISGLLAQCFVHQPWIPSLTCPLVSLLMCDTFPWIAWIAVPVYVCVCVRERERERVSRVVVVVQLLSFVQLFVIPWTAAYQASLSFTISEICSNSCPLSQWCHPTVSCLFVPSPLNLSQHQGLCQWVGFSYQLAKGLEL